MRVMTFQCWCLGSSGPCWEVEQSPPKNNLHSEWFVDTSHLPPCNVPRREMPSSELGGKSIEFGPTVNLEVSTWKVHQNHRVYTLDIRIMVAKVHPSHFFFCRIPKDVFKDVSLDFTPVKFAEVFGL